MSAVQAVSTSASTRAATRKPNPAPDDRKRAGNGGLTPRVRTAIDAQVFQGRTRAQAAELAGLCENALYQALRKPAVLAYWNQSLQVLRTGERARNVHRLTEIRDADNNQPAVQAIKVLEGMDEQRQTLSAAGQVQTPGVVIVINTAPRPAAELDGELIEINPVGTDMGSNSDQG